MAKASAGNGESINESAMAWRRKQSPDWRGWQSKSNWLSKESVKPAYQYRKQYRMQLSANAISNPAGLA
jgi:hypothetical protein